MAIPMGAIEPGSTSYGDRQVLEAGLSEVSGGTAPSPGNPGAAPTTAFPDTGNPFSHMLSGEISPEDQPLTSGLSVGPGPSPNLQPGPLDGDLGSRLKAIANQTTSPTLRRLAVARLRRMYRGVDNAN